MLNFELTKHAQTRLPQRSLDKGDIDLVLIFGTETHDGVILRGKDVSDKVNELKAQIKQLERLKNLYVVIDEGRLITAYKPKPGKMKKLMRRTCSN